MKTICLYFQIHQPYRLKRYRFFNIGSDHYYYDDFSNEDYAQRIAAMSYIPANMLMLEMIKESKGKFKVAFSISGIALDQLETYAPEVIDGFKELADTGCVEFLAEPHCHSLASLSEDPREFQIQVEKHSNRIYELFGQRPKVFLNTEMIYSDDIGNIVASMGYTGMLTEGAKRMLGWKSPNYVYQSVENPKLKLLLRNNRFSEDVALRFSNYSWSEYPLTADKYMRWIAETPESEQVINLFMNYEVLGNFQKRSTGIFEFMKALPRMAAENNISFSLPTEIIKVVKPVDKISSTDPMSWAGEEKDISSWLGNPMQEEAFKKLYDISERIRMSESRRLVQDWEYMQSSDHFYYMGTKGTIPFSPYQSPYDAFSNYMNILSDLYDRLDAEFPSSIDNEELNSLLTTIHNQANEIERLTKEVDSMKKEAVVLSTADAKKGRKKTEPLS